MSHDYHPIIGSRTGETEAKLQDIGNALPNKQNPGARGVELARGFTVGNYLDALSQTPPDRTQIADAIHRRFSERYLLPISSGEVRHGFTMMAISCLMIEALESFRQGWPDTTSRGAGLRAFRSFFDGHESFSCFRAYAQEFYTGVRCGILHQAETTQGWRIVRKGGLLTVDGEYRTLNATKFVVALEGVLDNYRDNLKESEWNSELWKALRIKMKRVCANCGIE